MSNNLKDKIEKMQIGKNIKETASAAVKDVKDIAKDTKEAAGDALDQIQKSAKEVLHQVGKKLG